MGTTIKRINESMRGAPALSATVGSLIALLDAFLVNGWGQATAQSLGVSGGVATMTLASTDTFELDTIIAVSGATPAELNGEKRVLSVTATTVTFASTSPDGPATGTITAKYAPCGWEKPYFGTNLAVYRSFNVAGSRRYLRVQDTNAVDARVVAYNSMTGVSTGTGPFPTTAQVSGGGYWLKSASGDTAPQRYDMFGDDALFYFSPAYYYTVYGSAISASPGYPRPFGDVLPASVAGDSWSTVLGVGKAANSTSWDGVPGTGQQPGLFVERAFGGAGGSVETYAGADAGYAWATSGADTCGVGAFPSSIDGRLRLSRCWLRASQTDYALRAVLPGLYLSPHSNLGQQTTVYPRDTVPGPGSLSGRKLMFFYLGGGSPSGGFFVDVTGPWR